MAVGMQVREFQKREELAEGEAETAFQAFMDKIGGRLQASTIRSPWVDGIMKREAYVPEEDLEEVMEEINE